MTYDDAGHYQVPGDDFDTVLEIFRHDRNGKSRREVAEEIDVPLGTVQNILERHEWYAEREEMAENKSVEFLDQ